MVNRSQHLSTVIGLMGLFLGIRYLVWFAIAVGGLSSVFAAQGYSGYLAAMIVVEPMFLATILFARHRLAELILGSEADLRLQPGRGLVLAGCVCLGLDLVIRGAMRLMHTIGTENSFAIMSPSFLSGAALLVGSRWIATRVTGIR